MSTRLYINLTNNCNANCEFCCMYSSEKKSTYISFEKFKEIIDNTDDEIELQLEGGEPLLHEDFYLFLEYANHVKKVKKIIILTNGFLLDKHLHRIVEFHKNYNIKISIKISINYWLIGLNDQHIDCCQRFFYATEFIPDFEIKFNVRLRNSGDDWITEKLKEKGIFHCSNIFHLQSYGKWSKRDDYNKPVIVQNIENWFVYACDGTCFGQDLITRSEYEKTLR